MEQIPFNTMPDGTCRTIKSQYFRNNASNFSRCGSYGATAIAVYSCCEDMEIQAERNGL